MKLLNLFIRKATSEETKSYKLLIKLELAIVLVIGGAIANCSNCAIAQIVPDASLGNESSIVTPQTPGSVVDLIEGGATRGANLFHSFEQFSVLTGREAFFNNAATIQNIISRVTGSSISNIDGLLHANGTANLFLINPNGIIFGPNATLALGGSFLGSTASSVNFTDGTIFSTNAPQTMSLLTVSVPLGLQFGGTVRSIINQSRATNSSGGVGLQVLPGKTLALLGGDVRLDNGNLFAPGGRVELGGVVEPGTVTLNSDSSLSFPVGTRLSDVFLINGAVVNVSASNSGSIALNARNLDILGESTLLANRESGSGVNTQAGDITLNATETITIANDSLINTDVLDGSAGSGGSINITTGSLLVNDGARLDANTFGQGDAGSVTINARDTISLNGVRNRPTGLFSRVEPIGVGEGGDINVMSGALSVTNGAQINASTFGRGNAGNVTIAARKTVSFTGRVGNIRSGANSEVVLAQTVGNGGDITITTGTLSVTDNARLSASTFGQGNAGNVTILARDTVSFERGAAITRVLQEARGQSGDISITTGSLFVTKGGFISTNTFGQGDAGDVTIRAREQVSLDGVEPTNGNSSRVVSNSESPTAVGDGGNVDIKTGSLEVINGAALGARTRGQGNGGNIILNANTLKVVNGGLVVTTSDSRGKAGNITLDVSDSVTLAGRDPNFATRLAQFGEDVFVFVGSASGLFANTLETSTGQGGDIRINSGQLVIQDGAEVNVSSNGSGTAGTLEVAARSIRLENQASLSSDTTAGQGNLILNSQDLVLLRGSNISTNAQGTATGGNITIDTDVIIASEDSDITANADEASGGRVLIDAQGIFGTEFRREETPQSDITASSRLGSEFSGTVEINLPDIGSNQGLVALPAKSVDASNQIANSCAGGSESLARNKFIITGRGGLPPSPTEPLNGEAVLTNWASLDLEIEKPSSAAPLTNPTRVITPTQIVEANGWVIGSTGDVIFTAQAPTVTLHRPWQTLATCHN